MRGQHTLRRRWGNFAIDYLNPLLSRRCFPPCGRRAGGARILVISGARADGRFAMIINLRENSVSCAPSRNSAGQRCIRPLRWRADWPDRAITVRHSHGTEGWRRRTNIRSCFDVDEAAGTARHRPVKSVERSRLPRGVFCLSRSLRQPARVRHIALPEVRRDGLPAIPGKGRHLWDFSNN
jgi:hypothetical protein